MSFHGQIMNLQCGKLDFAGLDRNYINAHKIGHRDARHAAAELALKADAVAAASRRLLDWVGQAAEHSDCINWYAVNADEGKALRDALALLGEA